MMEYRGLVILQYMIARLDPILSWGQTTDTAKHSREIAPITESDGYRNFPDPRARFLQELLCHCETHFVDQRPVFDTTGRQPSGQGALRDVHERGRKPRGWVAIGQVRLEHRTKRIYVVEVFAQNQIIRYT
jgi:hypothetical protein